MKLPRRKFLHLAAGIAAVPATARIARAQAYPTGPVRLIVGFPAGGTNDVHARLIAEWLSKQFGRSFVVENRPGATGNIATEDLVSMLHAMGIRTGIDLPALIACARRAQEILGRPLGSHTLVAGPVDWR